MTEFPKTLDELQSEILEHAKIGRSDALFRHAIAFENAGALARYLTHDQELNPISRPHGTKKGEINDAGHAIIQLMTYCALRGINLQEAVNTALIEIRTKGFVKQEAKNSDDDMILGTTACTGKVRGRATVILEPDAKRIISSPKFYLFTAEAKDSILVSCHPTADASHILAKFAGIVTDQGGVGCHAAIVARERNIPCVVGTGNATERIKSGDIIEINATIEQGQVWKV